MLQLKCDTGSPNEKHIWWHYWNIWLVVGFYYNYYSYFSFLVGTYQPSVCFEQLITPETSFMLKKSRGRRTLAHGVRPYLRSKELTERWVCPFSCCEWRDHLSYPSTLPVARPGSRGGRWLSLLSFFTRLHHKHFFYYPLPTSPFGVFSLLTFPAGCYSVMMVFSFFFQRTPRCCAVYHTKPWIFFE